MQRTVRRTDPAAVEAAQTLGVVSRELHLWRASAAAVWSVVLVAGVVHATSLTPTASWLWPGSWVAWAWSWVPLTWLISSPDPNPYAAPAASPTAAPTPPPMSYPPSSVITPALTTTLLYALLALAVLASALAFAAVRTVNRLVPPTSLRSVSRYFGIKYAVFVAVVTAAGAAVGWAVLMLRGSPLAVSSVKVNAGPEGAPESLLMPCLSEPFVYALAHCLAVALAYAVLHLSYERYNMALPRLVQSRMYRVRSILPTLLVRGLKISAIVSRVLAAVYVATATMSLGVANLFAGSRVDVEAPTVVTSTGMPVLYVPLVRAPLCMSPRVWWDPWMSIQLFVVGVIIVVTLDLTNSLAEVFLSQPFAFVGSHLANSSALLAEALEYYRDPLVRHLAFQDLCHVAAFDERRRMLLYQDNDGKAWLKIVRRTSEVIDGLTSQLAHWRVSESTVLNNARSGPYSTPTLLYWWAKRKLSSATAATVDTNASYGSAVSYDDWLQSRIPDTEQTRSLSAILADAIRIRPLLSSLLYPSPEAHTRILFDDLQLQLWCISGVAKLVAASYTDDPHGTVQRSLPDVLSSLLACAIEIDQHMALMSSAVNPAPLMGHLEGHQVLRPQTLAVASALHTSIYLIVTTFYESLSRYTFPTRYAPKLQEFADFAL